MLCKCVYVCVCVSVCVTGAKGETGSHFHYVLHVLPVFTLYIHKNKNQIPASTSKHNRHYESDQNGCNVSVA